MCDLGTLGSLVRFFLYLLATNCNTMTYNMGKLFDSCYIPKTVCSIDERGLGGCGLMLGLLFRLSEYGLGYDDIKWT